MKNYLVEQVVKELLALVVGVGQVGDRAVDGVAVQALHQHVRELAGHGAAPLASTIAPRARQTLGNVARLQVYRVDLNRLPGTQRKGDRGCGADAGYDRVVGGE